MPYNNRPTAPNDNQKPTCSTASGSNNSTAPKASARLRDKAMRRRRNTPSMTTDTITNARWVGSDQPASSAYSPAATMAPSAPINGAGTSSTVTAGSDHSQRPIKKPNTATRPICSPEIASR